MEAVHKSFCRSWIDNKIVNIRQFQAEFDKATTSHDWTTILQSPEELAEIEKQCGLESMRCEFQERVEMSDTINLPRHVIESLDVLRLQDEDLKKRKESRRYASAVHNHKKYNDYPRHKVLGTSEEADDTPHEPIEMPDVLLCVQIFLPERKQDPHTAIGRAKIPSFQIDKEYLVLGSQYLTDLREKIDCVSDRVVPGEFSDCPDIDKSVTCKDLYKSGFFYINGTFYNDMRHSDCSDYSEIIIKWSENDKRGIGPFKKALMEETKFIDLEIQLGYPYVYVHQGDCEHLIVFTDLRMFSKHDVNNRKAYPLLAYVKPMKRLMCMVCKIYAAAWVVYENKRLPEDPFFFCRQCFVNYNYDKNDQKIGSFKAYHYPEEAKMV